MAKTTYMWDELSDNVAAEYDDGVLSAAYTHESGLYGNLLSQNRNGVTSYYHYDGPGDTVALTEDSGNVTDTKEFDAWGNIIASTGSTVTPYQFVGRQGYQTGSTGVYVKARDYRPTLARWSSEDPRVFIDGTNRFVYVSANPLHQIDPSGEISVKAVADGGYDFKCSSPLAGLTFHYRIDEWPKNCNKGYFVSKLHINRDTQACNGKFHIEEAFTIYEFFVSTKEKLSPAFSLPALEDGSSFSPAGDSFEGSRGLIEHDREVRFYCLGPHLVPGSKSRQNRPKGVLDPDEIPEQPIHRDGYQFNLSTYADPAADPTFWKRDTGKSKPVRTWWLLDWDCCCPKERDRYVMQYSDPEDTRGAK